jgi:CDP-diacylglycerol--serine O-phosphatidyltransferase
MIKLLSVADVISITNSLFGFLAIIFIISNLSIGKELQIRVAFSFILLALIADGLDGIVARKIKTSEIGEYLESMADMTSMVIAPAVFIYFIYSDLVNCCLYRQAYLLFALILFLSFGIIRLASFHLMKNNKYFIGLPVPASTIILVIISFFKIEFIYILPAVVIIGAANVSDIKFPKLEIKINSIASILIILSLLMYDMYFGIAPLLLLIAIILYVTVGPLYLKYYTKNK